MKPKNILVVENDTNHFRRIKQSIQTQLGSKIVLSPIYEGSTVKNCTYNNVLIQKLREGKFQEVLDFYEFIDIYIVDIHLIDTLDGIGLKFCEYILKNVKGDYLVILISNDDKSTHEIMGHPNVRWFSKFERGRHFPVDLAKLVTNLVNSNGEDSPAEPLQADSFMYKLHELWMYLQDHTNRLIDK